METLIARSLRDTDMSQNDPHPDGSTYIPYEWVTGGECAVCHKPFEGFHLLSAQTCGDTCRKRLQRIRKREKESMARAMSELQLMRGGIKRKERVPELIEELKRLKGEINDLLHLAGDVEEMELRQMLADRKKKHP